jgi:hypothetical protein
MVNRRVINDKSWTRIPHGGIWSVMGATAGEAPGSLPEDHAEWNELSLTVD